MHCLQHVGYILARRFIGLVSDGNFSGHRHNQTATGLFKAPPIVITPVSKHQDVGPSAYAMLFNYR